MTPTIVNPRMIPLIAVLAAAASSYGIFSNRIFNTNRTAATLRNETVMLYGRGLYHHDSVSMAAQAIAQDWVTLLIAVPLLLATFIGTIRSSTHTIRKSLLLTGILGYLLYTYASYSFVAFFNRFFLLYTALMGLCFFCFVINILSFDPTTIRAHCSDSKVITYIGCSTIFLGFAVGLLWLGKVAPSLQGEIPQSLEHYTTFPIQAIDLGIVVPTTIIAGYALSRRYALGYLLAPIMIVKGVTLLLAIDAMLISMPLHGEAASPAELFVFPFLTVLYSCNLVLLFRNIREPHDADGLVRSHSDIR